jgi:hypothetical protein
MEISQKSTQITIPAMMIVARTCVESMRSSFCVRIWGRRAQTLKLAYRNRDRVEVERWEFFFFFHSLDSCAQSRESADHMTNIFLSLLDSFVEWHHGPIICRPLWVTFH